MKTRFVATAIACAAAIGGCYTGDGTSLGGKPSEPGTLSCGTSDEPLAPRQLRRLTRFEIDNTITDLLGVPSKWGQSLPPDDVVNGFDNNAAKLQVGALFADKMREAAEEIQDAVDLAKLVPCPLTSAGAAADACAKAFVASFGARAFRQPLSDADVARYVALYASVASQGFAAAIKAVVGAMLQSPYFLYRLELGAPNGGVVALGDYEIASELSYMFWSSMPDDELFAQAKAGALHTPEQIEKQARRLLASPRSRPMVEHFVAAWLDLDKLAVVPKDATMFPDFTPDIRAAMRQETVDLVDTVVRGGGAMTELFSARYSYMSAPLAHLYGATPSDGAPSSSGAARWNLGDDRGGLLTHGSILATQAKNNSSAPIQRGKLVRERFLCQPLPPPPAGLNVQLPPVDPSLSNRERFSAHDKVAVCAGCHHLMDPIGFGFEQFDAIGRFQTSDHGKSIDASGEILDSPSTNGKFVGVRDLEARLAASPDVQACFAKQWLRFAYGVDDEPAAACATQSVAAKFTKDLRIDELLVALVLTKRFVVRAADAAAGSPPPASDAGASTPDASPTPAPASDAGAPTGAVTVSEHHDSDWATGYCETVTVTNTGTSGVDWQVTLSIAGTIDHSWNCVAAPAGAGMFTFTGAEFNKHLVAGASASFGLCVNK